MDVLEFRYLKGLTLKKILLIIVIILAFILTGASWRYLTGMKRYFGVMPGAYLVAEFHDQGVKGLSYRLILDHPAQSVIVFYESRMKAKQWNAVEWKGYGNLRHWNIGKRTDPETKMPFCEYTYQAAWDSPEHDRVILMTLVYNGSLIGELRDAECPETPKDNGLLVTFKELPVPKK
jgi:hypothetical protein